MSEEVSTITQAEITEKAAEWRKINYYPCGKVFGPIAYEYNLGFVDATILSWLWYLLHHKKSEQVKVGGLVYVAMHYATVIEHNPMMNIENIRVLGRHVVSMEKKGILLRHVETTATGTQFYFTFAENAAYFLFMTVVSSEDIPRICQEWLQWKATGEFKSTVPTPDEPSAPVALSERFVKFIENVKATTNFQPNLYDKDGIPYKGMVELEKWYNALLDGTFAVTYKPANPDYDYTTIGPVNAAQILKAIQRAPLFVTKLPQFFMAFKTKRSMLLDTIAHDNKLKPQATKSEISDEDREDMKEDSCFQSSLVWMKKMYPAFDLTNGVVQRLWELHNWYIDNYDDLNSINKPGQYGYAVGKHGFDKMGEFIGVFARSQGKSPMVQDLKLDSWWWKKFALYMEKAHGCKILMDESIYRKATERDDANERLYEARSYDFT